MPSCKDMFVIFYALAMILYGGTALSASLISTTSSHQTHSINVPLYAMVKLPGNYALVTTSNCNIQVLDMETMEMTRVSGSDVCKADAKHQDGVIADALYGIVKDITMLSSGLIAVVDQSYANAGGKIRFIDWCRDDVSTSSITDDYAMGYPVAMALDRDKTKLFVFVGYDKSLKKMNLGENYTALDTETLSSKIAYTSLRSSLWRNNIYIQRIDTTGDKFVLEAIDTRTNQIELLAEVEQTSLLSSKAGNFSDALIYTGSSSYITSVVVGDWIVSVGSDFPDILQFNMNTKELHLHTLMSGYQPLIDVDDPLDPKNLFLSSSSKIFKLPLNRCDIKRRYGAKIYPASWVMKEQMGCEFSDPAEKITPISFNAECESCFSRCSRECLSNPYCQAFECNSVASECILSRCPLTGSKDTTKTCYLLSQFYSSVPAL